MNRASFIRNIIGLGIGAKIPGKLRNFKKIYLLECFVAGFRFYSGPDRLHLMQTGDLLELRREPDNEVDECAIAVYHNLHKIGFIPARDNKVLSRLIDADVIALVAEITHIEPKAAEWENVRIAVSLLKEQHGPLPNHALYLTELKPPTYRTLNRKKKTKDWYEILEQESQNDHFYSLWYSNGPYPDAPSPTHDKDFVIVRKSELPASFADTYMQDVAEELVNITNEDGICDYVVLRSDSLNKYLKAAQKIYEVFDDNGDNFLELVFS